MLPKSKLLRGDDPSEFASRVAPLCASLGRRNSEAMLVGFVASSMSASLSHCGCAVEDSVYIGDIPRWDRVDPHLYSKCKRTRLTYSISRHLKNGGSLGFEAFQSPHDLLLSP